MENTFFFFPEKREVSITIKKLKDQIVERSNQTQEILILYQFILYELFIFFSVGNYLLGQKMRFRKRRKQIKKISDKIGLTILCIHQVGYNSVKICDRIASLQTFSCLQHIRLQTYFTSSYQNKKDNKMIYQIICQNLNVSVLKLHSSPPCSSSLLSIRNTRA